MSLAREVFVHQAGKVGSQTVEAAIRAHKTGVERHHYLSDRGIAYFEFISQLPGADVSPGAASVKRQLRAAGAARTKLEAERPDKLWILSGLREPLEHAVSAFFQNLPDYCPELTYDEERVISETDYIIEIFGNQFERVISGGVPKDFSEGLLNLKLIGIDRWVQQEIVEFHDINIYETGDVSGSEICFAAPKLNLLLYRMETLTQRLPAILRKMGLAGDLPIASQNVGYSKRYGALYRTFQDRFKPNSAICAYYRSTEFFRRFYGRPTLK
jgi:hypothetical protein